MNEFKRAARHAAYRFLRRGKYIMGHDPLTLPILLRLTPLGISRQITEQTDIVVEGFPRSGNTFMVTALLNATEHRLNISSHVHHPSQVKLACNRGVPIALVIRDPLDTLTSYLTYGQHGSAARSIQEYCEYHRELLPYLDRLVICEFEETTTDLAVTIGRINERFSMTIPPFDNSQENTQRVLDEISRFHALTHPKLKAELVSPRPSVGRAAIADRFRSELGLARHANLMGKAQEIYQYYVDKTAEQRITFDVRAQRNPTAPRLAANLPSRTAERRPRDAAVGHQ